MSLIQQGRRRLNAPQADLYRESAGTRALAKKRIPNFRTQPLKRTATIGRLRTGVWADAEAGAGRTRAKVTL